MSEAQEFKVGDHVKVEFEATVTTNHEGQKTLRVEPDSPQGFEFAWVAPGRVTSIAPALPTKLGSVIESRGFRFMLTAGGWRADQDTNATWPADTFGDSWYAQDFTVILEGRQ